MAHDAKTTIALTSPAPRKGWTDDDIETPVLSCRTREQAPTIDEHPGMLLDAPQPCHSYDGD